MKGREVILVVLVVAIALGSGLIGLYLGRSSVQTQIAASGGPVGGGQQVAAGSIRLWDNPQMTGDVKFEIEANGRVYQGTVQTGQPILFFDGTTIYRGPNNTGEKLFTVEGNVIHVGGSSSGPAAYTIENNKIYEGQGTQGAILYNIDGSRMYEGANPTGNLVFQANQELTGDVVFILPILADQRYQ